MLVDARTLPRGSEIEGDICVAGAGAAGISLALALASTRLKVLLFESGALDFDAATQALYQGEVVGRSFTPLDIDRLRFFGGSTNHWGGGCRPFDDDDLAAWPLKRADLERYYARAQELCQIGPLDYGVASWQSETARPITFAPASPIRTGMFQNSPPTRFGSVYRQQLASAENVTVYLNANLVDIETDDNAQVVTAWRLACLGGASFRARGKDYVIAAGGIENARLLLNADRVQKAGLGNGRDLVGRFFMDHALVGNAATILFSGPPEEVAFYQDRAVRGFNVAGYLDIAPARRAQEGLPPLSFGLSVGSLPDKELAKESVDFIFRNVVAGRVPSNLAFYVGRILRGAHWVAQRNYERFFGDGLSVLSTFFSCGPPPDRESRVSLSHARDALGMRRPRLDWRLPGDFPRILARAHEILAQELGRAERGRVRLNFRQPGYDLDANIENAHHEMGTTRMHDDPSQGVVDANCRVHGIANLFVAGSSVFPTYSFENPTLTIIAMALRLADHLKGRASSG